MMTMTTTSIRSSIATGTTTPTTAATDVDEPQEPAKHCSVNTLFI